MIWGGLGLNSVLRVSSAHSSVVFKTTQVELVRARLCKGTGLLTVRPAGQVSCSSFVSCSCTLQLGIRPSRGNGAQLRSASSSQRGALYWLRRFCTGPASSDLFSHGVSSMVVLMLQTFLLGAFLRAIYSLANCATAL